MTPESVRQVSVLAGHVTMHPLGLLPGTAKQADRSAQLDALHESEGCEQYGFSGKTSTGMPYDVAMASEVSIRKSSERSDMLIANFHIGDRDPDQILDGIPKIFVGLDLASDLFDLRFRREPSCHPCGY